MEKKIILDVVLGSFIGVITIGGGVAGVLLSGDSDTTSTNLDNGSSNNGGGDDNNPKEFGLEEGLKKT